MLQTGLDLSMGNISNKELIQIIYYMLRENNYYTQSSIHYGYIIQIRGFCLRNTARYDDSPRSNAKKWVPFFKESILKLPEGPGIWNRVQKSDTWNRIPFFTMASVLKMDETFLCSTIYNDYLEMPKFLCIDRYSLIYQLPF